MRRVLTIGAAVLAVLIVPPTTVAHAAASTTQVPYPMDSSNQAGWWSPLETFAAGNQYAYLAFNEPGSAPGNHRVAIARRDGAGNWARLPLMNGAVQAEYADDIGHNQPSMARDGSGRFHVFASMHNNAWRYFRSDVSGGVPQNHSADLPDQGIGVTYPVVTSAPNGDLYAMARLDGSGSRTGRLYRWNNAASVWTRVAIFANSPNRSVYPDDLQFDSAGNLHLLWEWGIYPATTLRHQLSYLRYSPATGQFRNSAGTVVTVPVTTSTADVIQPLSAGEVYEGTSGPGVQSAKLTLNGTSPHVVYRYKNPTDFEVKTASVVAGAWSREIVFVGAATQAAIDVTWHPTQGKRVYYARSTGADRAYSAVKSGGAWVSSPLAPGLPIDRLSVERDSTGLDILYLADTVNGRLFYGRNP
jgi:hypothetical protein